jgi:hypothetical protein
MADPRIKSTIHAAIAGAAAGVEDGAGPAKPVPSQEPAAPAKAHKSAGPADRSIEANRMRAALRDDPPPPPLPFDDQIQRTAHLKDSLPVWQDNWRRLHVRNRLGLNDLPTLEQANLFPTVRLFDDHNREAAQYFDAAADMFRAGKTSLANGDTAGARLCFDTGQALTKGGLLHVKRNEQWQRMRLDHDRRVIDQKMIIEPSIDLMDNLAMETTFNAAGALFSAFRSAYRISMFSRVEAGAANAGRREFAELINDSERLAKTSPETLVSVSRAAGGGGLELEEARRLIGAAKLPGERARVVEQGTALRSEIMEQLKNNYGAEEMGLKEILNDEGRLSRAHPESLARLGRCVGLTGADAKLLVRSADLRRYAAVDGLNWNKAITALETMGDKQAAGELRAFINEIRGHHTAVSKAGRDLNRTMDKMRGMSAPEMQAAYGVGQRESTALAGDLKALGNKEVHFTNHDLLSVGGKTNTRVARNMGKAVGREDPSLREVIELHNRCNDHHAHMSAAGGPGAVAEARIETAVDLISAWRQKRAYKDAWDWKRIDSVIANPKPGDPWATDHALAGWLKVASRDMKQMEAAGFPLINPEEYIKLQPGQFLYE